MSGVCGDPAEAMAELGEHAAELSQAALKVSGVLRTAPRLPAFPTTRRCATRRRARPKRRPRAELVMALPWAPPCRATVRCGTRSGPGRCHRASSRALTTAAHMHEREKSWQRAMAPYAGFEKGTHFP